METGSVAEQLKQKRATKSGAKTATQPRRAKALERAAAPKKETPKASAKSSTRASKGLGQHSNTRSIFSYNSADDKNVLAIIDAVRSGISFNEFEKLVGSTPFSLAEWAHYLQVSERTIQRNQKEKKPFQPIQSERIVELAMLYEYGVDVFGDKENFNVWLNSKSIALGGRTPKDLLDTKFGVDMVKDELGRIEHGVLA